MEFTAEEKEFMDYLDELFDVPGGYGLLLKKGDPIAFQVGMNEYFANQEYRVKLWTKVV